MGDLDNPRPADWIAVECLVAHWASQDTANSLSVDNISNKVHERNAEWIARYLVAWKALAENQTGTPTEWVSDVLYALGYTALSDNVSRGDIHSLLDTIAPPTPPPPPVFNLPPDITIDRESYTDTYNAKTKTMDVFVVRAPFNETFIDHKVPGRWFDKSIKAWRVPVKSDAELLKALRTSFSGHTARMPDGKTFTL